MHYRPGIRILPIDCHVHDNLRRGTSRPVEDMPFRIHDNQVRFIQKALVHPAGGYEYISSGKPDTYISICSGDQALVIQLPAYPYDLKPESAVFLCRQLLNSCFLVTPFFILSRVDARAVITCSLVLPAIPRSIISSPTPSLPSCISASAAVMPVSFRASVSTRDWPRIQSDPYKPYRRLQDRQRTINIITCLFMNSDAWIVTISLNSLL